MQKLDGKSMDIVEQNIEQLRELFPEVFAEGKISFDKLQELLGNYVVEDEYHYNFTWHGKRQAGRLAQTPSTGTLRPLRDESVDWDTTQNLFIEGDNLEVLKLLQKSYHRQVKMIYIDPPYNTGNDFVYEDDFKDGVKNYLEMTGQLDSEGKRMGTNSSAAGRYHTNWLNMMYPRLKLARNLLRDDGVIFISIDDNEQANLKKLCDEVFGEENFVGDIIRKTKSTTNDAKNGFNIQHENLLIYARNNEILLLQGDKKDFSKYKNPDGDPAGAWISDNPSARTGNVNFPIENPHTGRIDYPPKGRCWGFSYDSYQRHIKSGKIKFKKEDTERERGFIFKRYLSEVKSSRHQVNSLFSVDKSFMNQAATKEGIALFGDGIMSYPKPLSFIKKIIYYIASDTDLVLDFFAGSGTTAHAVMALNMQDGGKRRHISVQLPELTDEKSDAKKAGYKNIADISKERIRRAAKKIKEENPDYKGDLGFKVFKLDYSNIKRWEADFDTLEEDLLGAVDYIKNGRSSEDVLYELLLKYGLDLTVPIETRTIAGKTVYSIGLGALVVCLEKDVSMDVVNGIGALKEELNPEIMRVVFKDEGFKDDVVKTNALQTLKRYGIEDIKSL